MTNETELHTRIRQLEDENERINRALAGEVTKLARDMFIAYEGASALDCFNSAQGFYVEALRYERGLGKQAEMENGNR